MEICWHHLLTTSNEAFARFTFFPLFDLMLPFKRLNICWRRMKEMKFLAVKFTAKKERDTLKSPEKIVHAMTMAIYDVIKKEIHFLLDSQDSSNVQSAKSRNWMTGREETRGEKEGKNLLLWRNHFLYHVAVVHHLLTLLLKRTNLFQELLSCQRKPSRKGKKTERKQQLYEFSAKKSTQ